MAWLYNLPLVGKTLGSSIVGLLSRLDEYRPLGGVKNQADLIAYLELQGYLDFRECSDHALATLYVAESCRIEKLWIDAFSHCVGLNHSLHASREFDVSTRRPHDPPFY